MRIIRREFYNCTRKSKFRIIPLGDIHMGARACDERALRAVIKEIRDDPFCYWIGMGDYCDFINRQDPRFSAGLADWIEMSDLTDLAKCQVEKFNRTVEPIAGKCLGLIEGNHETAIKKHSERDVFSSIVTGVKNAAGMKARDKLGLGYSGWLKLVFYRSKKREKASTVLFYLHHGFVGGRLAGAKALNMQRVLWTNDCDIALMGHSHNEDIFTATVHGIDNGDNFVIRKKYGGFTGTFLRSVITGETTYSEVKGYFPQATGQIEIRLKPHAAHGVDRIKMMIR
jgi:hypothetical protein